MAPATGTTATISLVSGTPATDVDAGLWTTATVGDTVFNDLDGNGTQDPGEPGLANVEVVLTGTDGSGAAVSLTATTDGAGNYSFVLVAGRLQRHRDTRDGAGRGDTHHGERSDRARGHER